MIHDFPNGMTVAELKKLVADWPEKDQYGEDYQVWLETSRGHTNYVARFGQLNSHDILLAPSESFLTDAG